MRTRRLLRRILILLPFFTVIAFLPSMPLALWAKILLGVALGGGAGGLLVKVVPRKRSL